MHGADRFAAQVAAAALGALAEQALATLAAMGAGVLRGLDDVLRHGAIVTGSVMPPTLQSGRLARAIEGLTLSEAVKSSMAAGEHSR